MLLKTCLATLVLAGLAAAAPNPVPKAATVSPDGSCGGTNGYICPSGNCCSQYGWCGTTSAYCGTASSVIKRPSAGRALASQIVL